MFASRRDGADPFSAVRAWARTAFISHDSPPREPLARQGLATLSLRSQSLAKNEGAAPHLAPREGGRRSLAGARCPDRAAPHHEVGMEPKARKRFAGGATS